MARIRDETKRLKILAVARGLFAATGFGETSISDIVRETGFPTGTIYTYFPNKEEILRTIVDEGWADLQARLAEAVGLSAGPREKIDVILDRFLPELLDEGDLVEIVLSEPEELTGLGQKMESLTSLLAPLVLQYMPGQPPGQSGIRRLKTALAVWFLGIVHASRLADRINPGFNRTDIIGLVRDTVRSVPFPD
jgi:AcrR family transcriptional regulator